MKKKIPETVKKGKVFVPDRLKVLNKTQRHAVLATDFRGQPYTSLVSYALTPNMRGIIFATPKNTTKYRNILKNKQVAVLIDTRSNTESGYMNAEAVTILGVAQTIQQGKRWSELSEIFIKKHPGLAEFIHAPTTALVLVKTTHCIHVSRFQTLSVWHVE